MKDRLKRKMYLLRFCLYIALRKCLYGNIKYPTCLVDNGLVIYYDFCSFSTLRGPIWILLQDRIKESSNLRGHLMNQILRLKASI